MNLNDVTRIDRTGSGMVRSASVDSAAASEPGAGSPPGQGLTKAEKALQARIANAPARKAATAARRATLAARTKPTGFRVGTWARTNTPRSPRFHNRSGLVIENHLGEVGLNFGTDWAIRLPREVDAWFLPTELTKIRPAQGSPA